MQTSREALSRLSAVFGKPIPPHYLIRLLCRVVRTFHAPTWIFCNMAHANSSSTHRCSHCSREFARSEHLSRHERTRSTYPQSKARAALIILVDTKEKPYQCLVCRRTFSRSDLLRRHEKKDHQCRWRDNSKSSWQIQPVVDAMNQLPLPNGLDHAGVITNPV